MQTPLGPSQSVLIKGVSLFRGVVLYVQDTFQTTRSVRITVDVRISRVSARRVPLYVLVTSHCVCVCLGVCVYVCVGWWAAYELYIVD